MALHRLSKKPATLGAFICILFSLCLWISSVQADGEEPFSGVIQNITDNIITIEVTQKTYSGYLIGEQIILHLTDTTKILANDDILLKPISRDLLSVGSLVQIKPNTLPDLLEADNILLIERRIK